MYLSSVLKSADARGREEAEKKKKEELAKMYAIYNDFVIKNVFGMRLQFFEFCKNIRQAVAQAQLKQQAEKTEAAKQKSREVQKQNFLYLYKKNINQTKYSKRFLFVTFLLY